LVVAQKVCRKPQHMTQVIGNLSSDRLRPLGPFNICGVDFCGPFNTTYRICGKPPYKSYVALFVCFASKAVHLELVSDLTTGAFLLAFQRFVSRRGILEKVWCANATNFVGADRHMRDFRTRLEEPRPSSDGSTISSAPGPSQPILLASMAQCLVSQAQSQEYVFSLQARNKWHQENVAVGALLSSPRTIFRRSRG